MQSIVPPLKTAASAAGSPGGSGLAAAAASSRDDASSGAAFMPARSFEYAFCVSFGFLSNLCGLVYFSIRGARLAPLLYAHTPVPVLRPPSFPFSSLGSVGIDISDVQWRHFYDAIVPIMAFMFLFVKVGSVLRKQARYRVAEPSLGSQLMVNSGSAAHVYPSGWWRQPAVRPYALFVYHAVVGVAMLLLVSGGRVLFSFALMMINYTVIRPLHSRLPSSLCLAIMWSFMIGTLFSNYIFHGYTQISLGFLERYLPSRIQWTIHYNMCVLRMIAYNNDYWEACREGESRRSAVWQKHQKQCLECAILRRDAAAASPPPVSNTPSLTNAVNIASGGVPLAAAAAQTMPSSPAAVLDEEVCCYKCRSEAPRSVSQFTLLSYFAYLLYPPLYFSGPMITFNAYASYVVRPSRSLTGRHLLRYGCHALGNVVFLVVFMHYCFVPIFLTGVVNAEVAETMGIRPPYLASTAPVPSPLYIRDLLTLEEKLYLLYIALAFLWCKFNSIWKLFRWFALMDLVETPEDMPQCFSNTVSMTDFWQSWHSSFNLWIVRYMYIPLGGNRRKLLTIVPIFFFIAIWHDIELRLLHWAMFMCVCFVPELSVIQIFNHSKWKPIAAIRQRPLLWRRVREVGATIGQWVLSAANLIGFSTGSSTLQEQLHIAQVHGIKWWFVCLFIVFYLVTGKVATRYRDVKLYRIARERQELGLA